MLVFPSVDSDWHSPYNYSHQPHDGLVETVKEVFQGLSLLLHVADDQTEANGEDHQAECVDSIDRPRHWDHLLTHTAIGCEYCVVHYYLDVDYPLVILGLVLGVGRDKWLLRSSCTCQSLVTSQESFVLPFTIQIQSQIVSSTLACCTRQSATKATACLALSLAANTQLDVSTAFPSWTLTTSRNSF